MIPTLKILRRRRGPRLLPSRVGSVPPVGELWLLFRLLRRRWRWTLPRDASRGKVLALDWRSLRRVPVAHTRFGRVRLLLRSVEPRLELVEQQL